MRRPKGPLYAAGYDRVGFFQAGNTRIMSKPDWPYIYIQNNDTIQHLIGMTHVGVSSALYPPFQTAVPAGTSVQIPTAPFTMFDCDTRGTTSLVFYAFIAAPLLYQSMGNLDPSGNTKQAVHQTFLTSNTFTLTVPNGTAITTGFTSISLPASCRVSYAGFVAGQPTTPAGVIYLNLAGVSSTVNYVEIGPGTSVASSFDLIGADEMQLSYINGDTIDHVMTFSLWVTTP